MNLEITWPPKFVRIQKIAETSNPIAPAILPEDYPYGLPTDAGSLPVKYSLDGWLLRAPVVGEPVRVLRFSRNGVIMPGIYFSTEVTAVPRDGHFTTINSIYHWQEVALTPS